MIHSYSIIMIISLKNVGIIFDFVRLPLEFCTTKSKLTLYGRMSTTGNIARLFYEEFFQACVEYQTHIAITKDTYWAIYLSSNRDHHVLLSQNSLINAE